MFQLYFTEIWIKTFLLCPEDFRDAEGFKSQHRYLTWPAIKLIQRNGHSPLDAQIEDMIEEAEGLSLEQLSDETELALHILSRENLEKYLDAKSLP